MTIPFFKYHGTGNDFILVDNRSSSLPRYAPSQYAAWCHRRFGVGADGLILIQQHAIYDFEMLYYNADGYEGSMCGNGGRCVVAFAQRLGMIKNQTTFMAADGVHHALIEAQQISLQMKNVDHIEQFGNDFVLDTGSPHYVSIVNDISAINIVEQGKKIRYSSDFCEKGINVNFIAPHHQLANILTLATYERGVEDETWSCGTGTVASAIAWAYKQQQLSDKQQYAIDLHTKGGLLGVSFRVRNIPIPQQQWQFYDVWLHGPAVEVFEGQISLQ